MDSIFQKECKSMTSHPNRSKKNLRPGRNPLPEEIKEVRANARLTQPEAAKLVYRTTNAWARWEGGNRRMPADTWELFQIKVKNLSTPEAPAK